MSSSVKTSDDFVKEAILFSTALLNSLLVFEKGNLKKTIIAVNKINNNIKIFS